MARSARQSVSSYPVLLSYSMTPSSRTMIQELATSTKFLQECQFLSIIKHPNVVQHLGTRPVLLMELMDESLTRFLERLMTGPLPYHSQLNDVALALAYLLDCFPHGVLGLQIITPNTGDASRYILMTPDSLLDECLYTIQKPSVARRILT